MTKSWLTAVALLLALIVPARGIAAAMLSSCISAGQSSSTTSSIAATVAPPNINLPCLDAATGEPSDCYDACERLLVACLLPLVQPSNSLAVHCAAIHHFAIQPSEHFLNAEEKLTLRPPPFQH